MCSSDLKAVGLGMAETSDLVLVGETKGELGQSIWLREILGREEGAPPPVDLAAEKRNGDFVRNAILDGTVSACHDIADGGILVAVAEMVMASRVGCELESPTSGIRPEAFWFGEDQARYLVCVKDGAAFCADAQKNGVPARILGRSGGSDLILPSGVTISAARLTTAHDAFFPTLMAR